MPVPVLKTAITRGRPTRYMAIEKFVCSILLQAFIAFPCFSQTIGNWTFNNTLVGTGGTHNTVSTADFSGSVPSKAYNSGTEYFGENGWPSGALNSSMYLQFSITPNVGYQLDLTRIVLTIRRSNTGSPAGSGPTSWSLRSSLDGYATDIATNSLGHNYNNYTVTLGSSFLHLYSTVTFRLYGYNTTVASGGTSRLVVNNISIDGLGAVLPLSLTGIQASHSNDKNISVKWQVNNVHEGSVFNVERSLNGSDFTMLNSFTEKETRSSGSYNFEDSKVPANAPVVFYRIKIDEPTGWTYYSWLVKVNNKTAKQLLIDYTTITGQSLVTALQVPEKGRYSVAVLATNGAVLQQRSLDLEAGVQVISLPVNALAHGTYVFRVTGNNSMFGNKKFVW
jgi:hypothetical protein